MEPSISRGMFAAVVEAVTKDRRLAAAAALALIIVIGATWQFVASRRVTTWLFDDRQLKADELDLMQIAFARAGLNDFTIADGRIEVPLRRRDEYLKALAEHQALPSGLAPPSSPLSANPFLSRSQQQQLQLEQRKQRITQMIRCLSFVQDALVEYDECRLPWPESTIERTAVVTVKPVDDRALTAAEIQTIRDIVRGGIAGMRDDEIVISDTFANRSYARGLDGQEVAGSWDSAIGQIERTCQRRLTDALVDYPGVSVEVTVEPRSILAHQPTNGGTAQPQLANVSSGGASLTMGTEHAAAPVESATVPWQAAANGRAEIPDWTSAGGDDSMPTPSQPTSAVVDPADQFARAALRVRVTLPTAAVQQLWQSARATQPTLDAFVSQIQRDVRDRAWAAIPASHRQETTLEDIDVALTGGAIDTRHSSRGAAEWLAAQWKAIALVVLGVMAVGVIWLASAGRSQSSRRSRWGLADESLVENRDVSRPEATA